jgi:predicted nucleic acid-binding protein
VSGWLLDTEVLSELRRPRPDARVRHFVASQRLEDLFISTVTFAEIRLGIEAVGDVGAGANLLSFGRFQNVDGIGAGLGWFQR